MAETLGEVIAEQLKYIDGVDDILGKFYYLNDPDALRHSLEQWILQTPAGRNWLDSQGFIHKEAVTKVIAQVEANLEQSNRDLVAKVQSLRSYVDAKGSFAEAEEG